MPNQIPNTLPGGPVNSLPGFAVSYIYYFRGASTDEQWYYASDLLGFGYGSSSTLLVYFRGAKDVNAVDTVTITLSAGTAHKDAAEYLLNGDPFKETPFLWVLSLMFLICKADTLANVCLIALGNFFCICSKDLLSSIVFVFMVTEATIIYIRIRHYKIHTFSTSAILTYELALFH